MGRVDLWFAIFLVGFAQRRRENPRASDIRRAGTHRTRGPPAMIIAPGCGVYVPAVTDAPAAPAQVILSDVATAANAAALRRRLQSWLYECGLPETLICDVVLGVNEALANCVDHAYRGSAPGIMTVQADHDPTVGSISVCITDHGRWRTPVPPQARDPRGRGIALMDGLADHCTIDGGSGGTTVRLDFGVD
jgi:serine/threonine-protein kinase RsbW